MTPTAWTLIGIYLTIGMIWAFHEGIYHWSRLPDHLAFLCGTLTWPLVLLTDHWPPHHHRHNKPHT